MSGCIGSSHNAVRPLEWTNRTDLLLDQVLILGLLALFIFVVLVWFGSQNSVLGNVDNQQ